ncbi:hypothetical protein ABG067_006560 [Albugo candida]
MRISNLKAYGLAALGAWTTYLQFVSGEYMQIENHTLLQRGIIRALDVQLVRKGPNEYIMAFHLDGSRSSRDTIHRCLPSMKIGSEVDRMPDVYAFVEDVNNGKADVAHQISFWEPAKKGLAENVNSRYTPGCWKLSESDLKKMRDSDILVESRHYGFGLNPEGFLDLAEEGVYSFAFKSSSRNSESIYVVERVLEPIGEFIPGNLFHIKIRYGNLLFENQNIAIGFGNWVRVPREVYNEIKERSEWVLGLELLGNHIINVNTQGGTKTYQILPAQKEQEAGTSSIDGEFSRALHDEL